MECLDPEEFEGEDLTAENIGYCELHPECCETVRPEKAVNRLGWLTRLLQKVFPRWEH